jgi:CheY-like chemotaxis protein
MAKILIIDDDALNRDIFERRLRKKAHDVLLLEDGTRAGEVALAERPDLILMDIQMPGLDGLEATRRLKADPLTRAIPVVGVSCFATAEDRQRALDAGCDDYETKPVDFPRLLAKFDELLQRKPLP